jgi:putative tricarboxylic transport membrane protein
MMRKNASYFQVLFSFNEKFKNIVSGSFFLLLAVSLLIYSYFFIQIKIDAVGIDSRFFPKLVGWLLSTVSLCIIYSGIKKNLSDKLQNTDSAENFFPQTGKLSDSNDERAKMVIDTTTGGSRILLTILLIAIYLIFLDTIGFLISSVSYLILQILLLTSDRKKFFIPIIASAVIMTVFVYVLFQYGFRLLLPIGIFG